ncbi:hypothetical protein AMST5_02165 [freshwater sediment metagenome]|uniref:Uncharacterized protein n=1 Tax=freshwater sediment metagenome TaxID=556182 RepID=A0AA48LZJ6_9ZZZZ
MATRLIRRAEAIELSGFKPTQFDMLIKKGALPQPFKLDPSCKATVWLESDWEDFLKQRKEAFAKQGAERQREKAERGGRNARPVTPPAKEIATPKRLGRPPKAR